MNANTFAAQCCALAMAAAIAHAGSARRSFQDHEVVMDKELLITSPQVVDSRKSIYPGPFSFGFLVEEAFLPDKAPEVVAAWLKSWVDGDEKAGVSPRPGVDDLIRQWKHADGYRATDDVPWEPNFENAPFRLLAIANRMDLAVPLDSLEDEKGKVETPLRGSGPVYYKQPLLVDATAGEGRFVFGAIDADGEVLDGGTTFILEYGLPGNRKQEAVVNWAMDWHALGKSPDFDGSYLAALAGVTGKFTRRVTEKNRNQKTNLLRIRINDGSFGATREFREFRVSTAGLTHGALAGTPRAIFFEKGTRENRWLTRWLRSQPRSTLPPATVRDDELRVPQFSMAFPARTEVGREMIPVVAMVAPVPENNVDYHWDGFGLNEAKLRRSFSMQTCCGCHCGDTRTAFFHIEPRSAGTESKLSDFMRTDGAKVVVRDPQSKRKVQLKEMEERKLVFESMLNPSLGSTRVRKIRENRLARAH